MIYCFFCVFSSTVDAFELLVADLRSSSFRDGVFVLVCVFHVVIFRP